MLEAGVALKDGETIGPSADVKWSVQHAQSQFVPGREVIVLGIP